MFSWSWIDFVFLFLIFGRRVGEDHKAETNGDIPSKSCRNTATLGIELPCVCEGELHPLLLMGIVWYGNERCWRRIEYTVHAVGIWRVSDSTDSPLVWEPERCLWRPP